MPVIELLSTPIFNAITWALLYSLWQAGIIYTLTWMLLQVNKQATAHIKHNLAAGAQLIIAVWMVITFIQRLQLNMAANASIESGISPLNVTLMGDMSQATASTQLPLNVTILLPVFLLLYLTGLLLMGWRMLLGYQETRQLRKQSISSAGHELAQLLENIQKSLQVKKRVQLYISALVNSPIMIGFFKPVILLPLTIFTQLSPEQIKAILIHEMAHIRRMDYLFNFLQSILESVLFFNPFVWLLSRIMREEREKACDEWVVREISPESYAAALLALEVSRKESSMSMAMAAKRKGHYPLLNRIKAFTMNPNNKSTKINFKQKMVSVVLVLFSMSCLAWLAPSATGKQIPKEKKVTSNPHAFNKNISEQQHKAVTSISKKLQSTDPQQKTNVRHYQRSTDTSILSPEFQEQLKDLEASAKKMSDSFENSDEWKVALESIKEKAMAMGQSLKMDPATQSQIEKLGEQAKAIAQKTVNSPAFKSQLKKLQMEAEKIEARADADSVWDTKAAESISKNYQQIMEQFTQDPEWQSSLKAIQQQATAISSRFVNNPDWDKNIRELTELASQLSNSIMNNPAFKKQLDEVKQQASELKDEAEKARKNNY